MKHLPYHFQLIFYNIHRLFHTFKFFTFKVRVFLKSNIHILFNPNIINNQSFIFPFTDTIHTRNCLNECMLLNWFVNINRIKLRHIKSRQPHVNYNGNLKIRLWILKLTVKLLTVIFCSKHIKKGFFIILIPCHYQFNFLHWL